MVKRMLVLLIVLMISVSVFSSSALAGPPWPAQVVQIRDGDLCYFSWLDDNYEGVTLTGPGMWMAQYYNGQVQWNCHTILDFASQDVISLDGMCDYVEWLGFDLCNGNGAFYWSTSYELAPLGCTWYDAVGNEYWADNAHFLVSPNGNVNLSCHFNMYP